MDPENEFDKIQPILMPALRTWGFVFSLSLIVDICIDLWLNLTLGEETDFISPETGDKWTTCVVIALPPQRTQVTENKTNIQKPIVFLTSNKSMENEAWNNVSVCFLLCWWTPWPKATSGKGLISFYRLQFSIEGTRGRDWRRIWTRNHGETLRTGWLSCLWMALCV